MRSVRLLVIEHERAPTPDQSADYEVRVLVDVDGHPAWHQITVKPRVIAGFDGSFLVASEELQRLFHGQQSMLHRICKLVGDELRGGAVR